ncbi:MAG: InlB B-repeat-containing protein [Clostridia bacterium]|nr:InlB B-repeat-containing protein [Clostridia bacterium]
MRKWLLAIMCCLCLASVGTGAFLITDYVQEQSKTESTEDPTVHTESNRYICVNQRMRYSSSGVTNQYNGQAQQGSYSYSKTDNTPFIVYWCDENGSAADWGTSPTANGNSVSGSNTNSGWCGSLTYTYNGYEVRRMAKVTISADSGYIYCGYSTSASWSNSSYTTSSSSKTLWLYGTGNVSTSQPSNSSSVVTATTNVTVYIFIRRTMSVSFNNDGGSGGQTTNITFTAGRYYSAIQSSVSVPTKTGYTFNGYYTAMTSGGTQAFNSSGTGVSNYYDASVSTLYAQWTAKRYAVTLVPTSATGGITSNQTFYAVYNSSSKYASSTGSTMASFTTPTRIGFTFNGWFTSTSGGTQVMTSSHGYVTQGATDYVQTGSAIWIRDGTATLYAQWVGRSISIKYDANGGTMGNGSATQTNTTQTGKYSSSVTATRTGYTNSGWSVNLVSTVATQYGGNQWLEEAGYSFDSGIITTGAIKTVAGHYYVLGVVPNSGVTVSERGFYLYSGSGYNASTDKVVTGKLQATSSYTHIIAYAITSSTNPTASTLKDFVVREMDSDGALVKASPTGTLLYDGAHTVLANWVGATYTLVYNMNGAGGASSLSNTSFTYNSTVTTSTPTAPGLTFGGWYTVGDGALGTGGSKITSDKTQMNAGLSDANFNHSSKTLTVYAKWSRNVYTITLAKNNGSGGTSTIYERYGDGYYLDSSCSQKMTTSANAITKPSRPGYSFNGYTVSNSTFIDSNGFLTSASTSYLAADYTFTAQWTAKTITITLNNQDATSAGTTKVYYKYATATYYSNSACTSSYAITSITKPTKTHYTFIGYYSSGNATQYINSSGGFTNNLYSAVSASTTLYARWIYAAQSVNVHVMTASALSTTFSESITGMTRGNVIGIAVSGPYSTVSGGHALSTTSAVTTFNWKVDRTMEAAVTPASGYVYAGISTSSSLTMSSSPETTVTITSSVSDVYIFLKQTTVPLYHSTARGGYWYYEDGYFPQTYVSDSSTISALNSSGVSQGNFNIGSGQTVPIYKYNNEYYAKVAAPRTQTIKLNSGSNVSFTSGSNYWFKCEPIRWRITPYGTSSTKYSVGQTLTNVYGISDMLGYGLMNALSGNGVTAGKNSLDMSGSKVANTMSFAQFSSYGLGSFNLYYSIYGNDSSVGNASIDEKSVSQSGTTMYVANAAKGIGNNIGANAASPSTYIVFYGNDNCTINDMFYSSDLSAFLAGQNYDNGRGWVNDLYNLGSGYTLSADGTMITTFLDQMYGYIFCHLVTYSTGNGSKT